MNQDSNLNREKVKWRTEKMDDPVIYSDLSAVIIVLGGILLIIGIRWMLFKRTETKFLALMIACAIAEMTIGSLLIISG